MISYKTQICNEQTCKRILWFYECSIIRKPLNPLKNNHHITGFLLKSNVLRIYICTRYMNIYTWKCHKNPKIFSTQSLSFNFECLLPQVFTFCSTSSWMSVWVGQIAGAKQEGNCFRKAGFESCSLLSFPSPWVWKQSASCTGWHCTRLSLTQGDWTVICKKIRYLTDAFWHHCGKHGTSKEGSFLDLNKTAFKRFLL